MTLCNELLLKKFLHSNYIFKSKDVGASEEGNKERLFIISLHGHITLGDSVDIHGKHS